MTEGKTGMTEGEKQILRVAQDDHIGVLPGLPEGEKRDEIAGVRRQKTKSNDAGSPIRSGMTEGKNGDDGRGTWEGQRRTGGKDRGEVSLAIFMSGERKAGMA